ASLTAKLHHDIADLADTCGAHGMALRLETAAGVHGPLAVEAGTAFDGIRSALALRHEPEIFQSDNLGDGEAVVYFGELYIGRRDAGHLVGFGGGGLDGAKRGDVVLFVEGKVIRCLGDSAHTGGALGEFRGAIERRDYYRRR